MAISSLLVVVIITMTILINTFAVRVMEDRMNARSRAQGHQPYENHWNFEIVIAIIIMIVIIVTSFLSSLRLQKNLWVISTSRKRAPIEPTYAS